MPPNRSTASRRRRSPAEYNKDPCTICGETVKYIRDIERHNLRHAANKEELKVRCPVSDCGYSTLQKSNVTMHVRRVHKTVQVHHCQPSCNFCTLDRVVLAKHQIDEHGFDHDLAELEKLASLSKEKLPEPLLATPDATTTVANPQKQTRKQAQKNQPCSRSTTDPRHDLQVAHEDVTSATYQYGQYAPKDGSSISSFPGWLPYDRPQLYCDGSFTGYSTGYNGAFFQGQFQTWTEPLMSNARGSGWGYSTPQTLGYPMGYHYSQELFGQHSMSLPPSAWDAVQNTPQSSSHASTVTPYNSSSGSLPLYHWNGCQNPFPSVPVDNVDARGNIDLWGCSFPDMSFESEYIQPDGTKQLSTPVVQDLGILNNPT